MILVIMLIAGSVGIFLSDLRTAPGWGRIIAAVGLLMGLFLVACACIDGIVSLQ